jgi:hypothetical protein
MYGKFLKILNNSFCMPEKMQTGHKWQAASRQAHTVWADDYK